MLRKWGLSKDMREKIRLGSFFEQAETADMYVFVAKPKSLTAKFKLEIATMTTTGNGGYTNVAFVRLENIGWLAQHYICAWASESGQGSGTRHCSKRGFQGNEINDVKSTLELHAWKQILKQLPGKTLEAEEDQPQLRGAHFPRSV